MSASFPEIPRHISFEYLGFNALAGGHQLRVLPENSRELLSHLLRDSSFWCDYLISVSGEHLIAEMEKIRIHYHMCSYTRGIQIHVWTEKTISTGERTKFSSISDLWKTAAWHERECAELFGLEFENHPNPANLLLPNDWEGYPLRKDYRQQESYHGIKLKYE